MSVEKINSVTGITYIDNNVVYEKESETAKNEHNDCVVRAFASVTGKSYDECHKFTKEVFGRRDKQATYHFEFILNTPFDTNRFGNGNSSKVQKKWDKLYKNGYERVTNNPKGYTTPVCKLDKWGYEINKFYSTWSHPLITKRGEKVNRMTVGTFIKNYPKGKYLISIRGHAFAIINGVVMGNPEDSRKMRSIVSAAYKFV